MEVVSRVESRPEYLSWEAAVGARKLVEQIMLVKPGEQVIITGDTSTDRRVVELTAQAVAAAGAVPTVVWYETRPSTRWRRRCARTCTWPPTPRCASTASRS